MEIDKVIHSITGIAITFTVAFILLVLEISFESIRLHWIHCIILGYLSSAIAGVLREVANLLSYGVFDINDFYATINPTIFFKFLIFGNDDKNK